MSGAATIIVFRCYLIPASHLSSLSRTFGWFSADTFPLQLHSHFVGLVGRKAKTAHFMHDLPSVLDDDSLTNVVEDDPEVSIDGILINPTDDITEDGFTSSQPDSLSSDGEEHELEDQAVDDNTSVETLIDIDPAIQFNWFVSVGYSGVGLFRDIYAARKLRAAGTTVYYFCTLSDAKKHFWEVFDAWCRCAQWVLDTLYHGHCRTNVP
ncbi:hypothetical protein DFJ58DRAFT_730309 [Suillus subalutaceus]|uniref:uncharacterized protein n=1 Tax=Suillus subalutaceus TaxID=48586 RepID=UPI001B86C4B4|nr:uncharacterized protein DFJ58DRAFT_730309 [Suillus subalutaceus]KAG1846980.1 hypothetical protein DFJ58DRAFT_730309 [Suillus subalutaceus]